MAKKMKKKNYAKHLPRAGSSFAVAMAMTVALSTQVSAAEIDERFLPVDPIPGDPVAETVTSADRTLIVAPQSNEEIQQNNDTVLENNENTAQNNGKVEQDNDAAAENNESLSGGQLENPDLDLPDAPELPIPTA